MPCDMAQDVVADQVAIVGVHSLQIHDVKKYEGPFGGLIESVMVMRDVCRSCEMRETRNNVMPVGNRHAVQRMTDVRRYGLEYSQMVVIERVRELSIETDDSDQLTIADDRGAEATTKAWK